MRLKSKKKGFTLIEVLIALAIFSVMSMMAYGGLKTLLNARNGTERAAIRLSELQMAMLLIQQDMEHMVLRGIRVGYEDEGAVETGGIDYLITFTRGGDSMPRRKNRSGLYRVAYQEEDGELKRMIWSELDRMDDSKPKTMVLLHGVSDVAFAPDFSSASSSVFANSPGLSGGPSDPGVSSDPDDGDSDKLPRSVEMVVTLDDWGTITRLFAMPY